MIDNLAHFFVGGGADDLILDDALFVKNDGDGPGRGAAQTLEEGVALVVTAVDKAGIGGQVFVDPCGDVLTKFLKRVDNDDLYVIALVLVQIGELRL